MENPVTELEHDIEELESILKTSKRKNVQTLLSAWIEKLESEKVKMQKVLDTAHPQKVDPV